MQIYILYEFRHLQCLGSEWGRTAKRPRGQTSRWPKRLVPSPGSQRRSVPRQGVHQATLACNCHQWESFAGQYPHAFAYARRRFNCFVVGHGGAVEVHTARAGRELGVFGKGASDDGDIANDEGQTE